MPACPECGVTAPPDPETGYDGDDFCSSDCEERSQERDTRFVVEARVADDQWVPCGTGVLRRLLVFEDKAVADWWVEVLNSRRGSRVYRARPTMETDEQIRRRRR